MKKVLVVGASGATGKLLVADLLQRNAEVVAVVRASSSLVNTVGNQSNYREILASITELSEQELIPYLKDCDVVLSCLGHNLTFKGMFGEPKRLVTDTIKKVSRVIESLEPGKKVKIILMNTTGNSNRDMNEPISFAQKSVVGLLRLLLPPHADNEQAADYLRSKVGQNDQLIEWAAVRPDGLIDEDEVTPYDVHPSPIRSAIFDPGQTSRINVGHFIAELITEDDIWRKWQGQMPVIYNKVS